MDRPAGVFIGLSSCDYADVLRSLGAEAIDAYRGSGTAFSAAAGRISFALGLEGPTVAIDTACSSSLVAVHEACQALRAQECGVALAGGVNLILAPDMMISVKPRRDVVAGRPV